MSSIFEKIALKVISYYLDNYINPIQGSQIKLALTTGNAELNNVSIKSTALSTHHLPFTVTSGLIQSIKLHFPWHSLKKRPCVIEIEGIHIIANFSKSVKLKSELEIKESVLKELEDAGLGDEKIKNALFQGTISQIISNIIINIKNIHIRVEISTPDPNTTFAVGLMCDRIELFSIGENGKQTFVQPGANISKRIEIHDFSIYADPQPDHLDLPTNQEKVEEYLKMRYNEKHEYILDSFSFSSDYIIKKHQLQTCSNMDNLIEKICFKLTQKQMAVFGEYLYQYNLFQLRKRFSLCGRPENPSINDDEKLMFKWWRFVHQCTIEKRYPNRINIQESVLILKTRTSYYNIWKIRRLMSTKDFKKNSNYKILKKIEDRLPLNSILFLRNYSDYRINKEKEDKFVLDENDLNMLTNSNTLENSADISLLIKSIKVKIYESNQSDEKPILTFAAHELNNKFIHSFDKSSSFSLICKLLKIYSREKIIFQQDSTNRSSVELKYAVTPVTKEKHVDIIASDPFINVDLIFLYKLKIMLIDNGFKKCPSSSYFSFTKKIAEIVEEESNKYTPYMIRKGQYADMIL